MHKEAFQSNLRKKLAGLPQADLEERLSFYTEMIDDRMEEGLSEEDAVAAMGDVDKIAEQIIQEIPFFKAAKEKLRPKRRLAAWEIVLLVLGAPIWASLLVAALAVVFSLFATLCSVVICLWAIFVSLIGSAIGAIISCTVFAFGSAFLSALAMLGIAAFATGVAIFLFYGCKAATDGITRLCKGVLSALKMQFLKKEVA